MQNIDKNKAKIRRFSSALIAKLDTAVLLNVQALRSHHESLTASDRPSEISQDDLDLSCPEEAGENFYISR